MRAIRVELGVRRLVSMSVFARIHSWKECECMYICKISGSLHIRRRNFSPFVDVILVLLCMRRNFSPFVCCLPFISVPDCTHWDETEEDMKAA
jgi:hypothetical protein